LVAENAIYRVYSSISRTSIFDLIKRYKNFWTFIIKITQQKLKSHQRSLHSLSSNSLSPSSLPFFLRLPSYACIHMKAQSAV